MPSCSPTPPPSLAAVPDSHGCGLAGEGGAGLDAVGIVALVEQEPKRRERLLPLQPADSFSRHGPPHFISPPRVAIFGARHRFYRAEARGPGHFDFVTGCLSGTMMSMVCLAAFGISAVNSYDGKSGRPTNDSPSGTPV
jgi:hypothetical protein